MNIADKKGDAFDFTYFSVFDNLSYTNLTSYLEKKRQTHTHTIMWKTNYETLFLINITNKKEEKYLLTVIQVVWVVPENEIILRQNKNSNYYSS